MPKDVSIPSGNGYASTLLTYVVNDGTAVIAAAVTTIGVANTSAGLTARPYGDSATRRSVESHLVLGVVVDAFDDVDFAIIGPVGAEHPAMEKNGLESHSDSRERALGRKYVCLERKETTYNAGHEPQALPWISLSATFLLGNAHLLDSMLHTGICGKSPIMRPCV